MEEQFTAEEQAALDAMEADQGESEPTPEPQEQPAEPEQAEPEAEAGEADKAPEDKPADKERPPEGYVPHGALHREREERKRIAAELEELKAWRQAQEQPAEQPPEYVDPLENPEGFRKWAEYNQARQDKALEEQQRQAQEQHRAQAEAQQMAQMVTQHEEQFRAQTPDYQDAVDHLASARRQELQAQGLGDDEIKATMHRDVQGLYQASQQLGMNVARLAYMRAQDFGYAPKPTEKPKAEAEGERIEAQAKSQRQTQSLGHGGGEQQSTGWTPQQLASLSDDEFAKLSEADIRKAMGG